MHSVDSQYQSQVFRSVNTLLRGAGGEFSRIPESYSKHLAHNYSDGDISLLSKIHTFEFSELEEWEVEDALHELSKQDPANWPNLSDITSIDLDAFYHTDEEAAEAAEEVYSYAEKTDLEYSDKVHRVLKGAIEHAFGAPVSKVGTSSGKPPHKDNQYCRRDNKYCGQFEHDKHIYEFELTPDDDGNWHVAYRLNQSSKDKLFKPDTSKNGGKKK